MKNKGIKFIFYPIIFLCVAVCFIRFYQLLKYTDADTGLVIGSGNFTFVIYGLLAVEALLCIAYALALKKRERRIDFTGNKNIYVSLLILGGTYFYDFIRQIYSLVSYLFENSDLSYGSLSNFIPIVLLCAFSLLTCIYIFMCAFTVNGATVDFRRFTLMHFVPLLWGFTKMLVIMTDIFDFKRDVDGFLEIIFLIAYCGFSLCCISALDNKGKPIKSYFGMFCIMVFVFSAVLCLPRIFCVISGKRFLLSDADFSSVTYLMIGVFALVFELNTYNVVEKN